MESHLIIRDLVQSDLDALRIFTDREIGQGYFSNEKLKSLIDRSWVGEMCSSLVLYDGKADHIAGIRLSYAPGQWALSHPSQKLHEELWDIGMEDMAYFQSIFLDPQYQGRGLGGELSKLALKRLKLMGAKAVLCHSWKESPNNSSRRYLEKLGFRALVDIPMFWNALAYTCSGCGLDACKCTATEMVLYL